MSPKKITTSIVDGISAKVIWGVLFVAFTLGGMQWQYRQQQCDINELMAFKDAETQQYIKLNSRHDETQSLIKKSNNIVAVRTHDRWTKTDDKSWMSAFAYKNKLEMLPHIKTTPVDPEIK